MRERGSKRGELIEYIHILSYMGESSIEDGTSLLRILRMASNGLIVEVRRDGRLRESLAFQRYFLLLFLLHVLCTECLRTSDHSQSIHRGFHERSYGSMIVHPHSSQKSSSSSGEVEVTISSSLFN